MYIFSLGDCSVFLSFNFKCLSVCVPCSKLTGGGQCLNIMLFDCFIYKFFRDFPLDFYCGHTSFFRRQVFFLLLLLKKLVLLVSLNYYVNTELPLSPFSCSLLIQKIFKLCSVNLLFCTVFQQLTCSCRMNRAVQYMGVRWQY